MTNSKTTKRALVTSVLSIVLCLVMLIGSTFAWFTDTASTSVNKIQAGNLKISLVDEDGNDLTNKQIRWTKKIDGNRVPAEDILWEPGCTYRTEQFYLRNDGNLAVKYKFNVNFTGDTKLLEVLEFTVKGWGTNFTGGFKGFSSLEEFNNYEGHLLPASESVEGSDPQMASFEFKVHMKEEAGNEYQGLSLGDMKITVVATQYTYESDSTGNDYDKDATYPVASSDELSAAIGNLKTGDTLTVGAGEYAMPADTALPQGTAIDGAGVDKTNLTAPATKSGKQMTGLVVNNSGVKISNATINGNSDITSDMYCGVVDIREGGTTMENVKVVNRTSLASGVVINRGVDTGETVALRNMTFDVYYRALYIADSANGTIEVSDSDITGSVYALNVNSNSSQDLVLKFTNSKLHGWSSYGKIKSATFENVEFSKGNSDYDYLRPYADTTLKNCTFDSEFLMGAGTTGFTITMENCTFNGVAVTATNVSNMLDKDDLTNLRGCTIIVNGVTVTL